MDNMALIFLYHLLYSSNYVSSYKNELFWPVCCQAHFCEENVCKECIKYALLFKIERDFNSCGSCLIVHKKISTGHFSNIVEPSRPTKLNSVTYPDHDECVFARYCYEKFCATCFDCSLLSKLPPINRCAKDFNQSGFCIPGFQETSLIPDLTIMPWEKKTQSLRNFPRLVLSLNNVIPFCILLGFAAMVIKLIIRKNKVRNDATVASFERSLIPSAPPLVPDNSGGVLREEKNEKCSTARFAAELKQQPNTAKVFKQPHAAYYYAKKGTDDVSDHSKVSNESCFSDQHRSEPEKACSLNIFIHSYTEVREHISPFEEMNESVRDDSHFKVPEDGAKNLHQREDSNSPKS